MKIETNLSCHTLRQANGVPSAVTADETGDKVDASTGFRGNLKITAQVKQI